MRNHPLTLTRAQAHALVRAWCAPHLWAERHREIDALYDVAEPLGNPPAVCLDCGKPYTHFGIDVILPNDQWALLSGLPGGNGLLCGACIVARAAALSWVIRVDMQLVGTQPGTQAAPEEIPHGGTARGEDA